MNYWTIDLKDLPSEGEVYYSISDPYIKIHPLTVADCKYLTTINPNNKEGTTFMLNQVLQSCMKSNIPFGDLAVADRNWLLFWVRVNSFINSNGYNIKVECPQCGRQNIRLIKLDDLNIKKRSEAIIGTTFIENTVGERVQINGKIPRVKDKFYTVEDKDVEDILNYTTITTIIGENVDPVWYVNRLDAFTFAELRSLAQRSKFGIDEITKIKCDDCGNWLTVQLDMSDTNIFGRISLFEVLKTQIQVSKYCGFQISDDNSYSEVEIMQDVIKQMIDEEQAEAEKQKGNMTTLTRTNIKMPSFHK